MSDVGKLLIVFGLVVAGIGVLLMFAERLPWIGHLPGDITVQRGRWTFYVPLATSLVVSLVLTVVVWLIGRR